MLPIGNNQMLNKNINKADIRAQAMQAVQTMNALQFPTCLRLLVSEISAKSIVGAGGYELERIRSMMDGALNVEGDSGLPGTVTFQSVKEHILWAVSEISSYLALSPPPYVPHIPIKADVILNVLMPESVCGYFIGKGGLIIKRLSKIESDVLPESNEKVLIIAGNFEKIDFIIEYILDFFFQQKIEPNSIRFYYSNYAQLQQNGILASTQYSAVVPNTQNITPYGGVSSNFTFSTNVNQNYVMSSQGYVTNSSLLQPQSLLNSTGIVNNQSSNDLSTNNEYSHFNISK